MTVSIHRGPWAARREDLEPALGMYAAALDAARAGSLERPRMPEVSSRRSVAILPVRGLMQRERNLIALIMGSTTYDLLGEQIRGLAADESVAAIVLDVDSPGGDALGLAEVADAIYEARSAKPIVAVVRALGTSAGYFLASSAERVVVAREAVVGAIGSVLTVVDFREADRQAGIEVIEIVSSQSPRKRPDPTTEDGRAQLQEEVDAIAQVFVESVARNRGVSAERVLRDFGRGGVFVGQGAVEAGLADAVGTLEGELARLGASAAEEPTAAAEEAVVPPSPLSADEASAWEEIEAEAGRLAAREALQAGERRQDAGRPGRAYARRLREAGIDPELARRLVEGDEAAARELGVATLAASLRQDREERAGYLRDAEEAEQANASVAPSAHDSSGESRWRRAVAAAGEAVQRAGLIR